MAAFAGVSFGVLFISLLALAVVVTIGLSLLFRRVVSTNMVQIVQTRKNTISYGTGQKAGNVFYQWPAWVPIIGVKVIRLPVSNFDLTLTDYEAYDEDRVPFMVDVTAFFRIADTAVAAQRVSNVEELTAQLDQIVKGAVRKVLAGANIDKIMLERATFGDAFTEEVQEQLREWGCESVKSMELMDIRDNNDSNVIANIMAKKTSFIDMESRKEVAENKKKAETAEIEAQQAIDIRTQEAEQAVGERTAEKDKKVGIADEQSKQEVLAQEKVTTEKQMEVKQVEQVKQAEITKEEQVVAAKQDKETKVIIAEGELAAEQKRAEGIKAVGEAEAAAETAMQLAPVDAQIKLAKEIGENDGYQEYLVKIEGIGAYKVVGQAQATALQEADVKVISNTGKPAEGLTNVMDLFSSTGGTEIAGMVEAFGQSPLGQALLQKSGVIEAPPKGAEDEDQTQSLSETGPLPEKGNGSIPADEQQPAQ